MDAAEAAARSAEGELRVALNVAESLRAELRDQAAALEALRASSMPKGCGGVGVCVWGGGSTLNQSRKETEALQGGGMGGGGVGGGA